MNNKPKFSDVVPSPMDAIIKDQILIALLKRLADEKGNVVLPVDELDNTGQNIVEMEHDIHNRAFNFKIRKKS